MIKLSNEQVRELQGAQQPPTVINPYTREEFVLVRRDVYDRLRSLLDLEFKTEDGLRNQIESAAAAGCDPALDIYNDLETPRSGLAGLFGKYRDDPTLQEICDEAYKERDADVQE